MGGNLPLANGALWPRIWRDPQFPPFRNAHQPIAMLFCVIEQRLFKIAFVLITGKNRRGWIGSEKRLEILGRNKVQSAAPFHRDEMRAAPRKRASGEFTVDIQPAHEWVYRG